MHGPEQVTEDDRVTTTARPALPKAPAAVGLVMTALTVVYVVWGSTYLGIRVVVKQAPPFLGMGSRFFAAGLLLAALIAARSGVGRLRVTRRELLGCTTVGLLLPVLGNGLVSVGEDRGAPSGVTALLIASAPLMIAIFRFASGDRPRTLSIVGLLLGFVGLAYLVLVGRNTRAGAPSSSRLLSTNKGDSVKRKFFTAFVTVPFSISHNPSRVSPVERRLASSSVRTFHSRVTNSPRLVVRIISSIDVFPPLIR